MKEIKCPKCGNVFQVDEADYASIANQVRNAEFEAELERRMREAERQHETEQQLAEAKAEHTLQSQLSRKDEEIVRLQNQLQVIAKNMELTEKVIEQMKARRQQGTVLKNDLTRYELQLQSLQLAKTQLVDAQKIIRHQMSTAIHLPDGEDFEVDTQSLEAEGRALKSLTSESTWQQTAAENNIGIRQALLVTEMSEQKVKNTRAASLPSVAVVAENNLAGPYTSDLIPKDANVNVWFVGIGVKYNLSSLWKNKHAIRKAKKENTQARERVQLAQEGIENGVQANYTNLLTSSVEVSTQEKQVELADQHYAVV